jgi:ABC-type antimicrobial peptide transport system permease subunit
MARASLPLAYAWRNVLARKLSTTVTLLCVAVSIMVYVVMAATAAGIQRVAVSTGDPRNVIVTSDGASSIEASRLTPPAVSIIRHFRGVAQAASGEPMASVELMTAQAIPRAGASEKDATESRYTSIRGVAPIAFEVHSGVGLVRGRFPGAPGEILIGRLLPTSLGAIDLGDALFFADRWHPIVGVFEAKGQIFESEVWMRLEDLQAELDQREVSAVVVRASDPRRLPEWIAALQESRRVNVDVRPELEYYADVQRGSAAFSYLGNLIGLIMGLGAIAAGMNTTYAAMSRRVREMGTLRALGFGRWSVGRTILFESTVIGALGGVAGVGLAFAFDGFALSLMGLAFELEVRAESVAEGVGLAVLIGALGGLMPARAAARLEIVEALRQA